MTTTCSNTNHTTFLIYLGSLPIVFWGVAIHSCCRAISSSLGLFFVDDMRCVDHSNSKDTLLAINQGTVMCALGRCLLKCVPIPMLRECYGVISQECCLVMITVAAPHHFTPSTPSICLDTAVIVITYSAQKISSIPRIK